MYSLTENSTFMKLPNWIEAKYQLKATKPAVHYQQQKDSIKISTRENDSRPLIPKRKKSSISLPETNLPELKTPKLSTHVPIISEQSETSAAIKLPKEISKSIFLSENSSNLKIKPQKLPSLQVPK